MKKAALIGAMVGILVLVVAYAISHVKPITPPSPEIANTTTTK